MTNLGNTENETPSKKRGRQPLPPGEKKEIVSVRVSPNTLATLKAAAIRENLDFQKWVRKTLTDRARGVLCITD